MGSQPRFPGWLLGSCWDPPGNPHATGHWCWMGALGGSGCCSPIRAPGVPKTSGCNRCLLPALAPLKGGSQLVPGRSLWSLSGRGGNSESAAVLIRASHLLFGRDSHMTHFDPTASCPPAFHCPWSRGCPLPPDIPTPATALPLGSHPLFQASKPVLPVRTSLSLRALGVLPDS